MVLCSTNLQVAKQAKRTTRIIQNMKSKIEAKKYEREAIYHLITF